MLKQRRERTFLGSAPNDFAILEREWGLKLFPPSTNMASLSNDTTEAAHRRNKTSGTKLEDPSTTVMHAGLKSQRSIQGNTGRLRELMQ